MAWAIKLQSLTFRQWLCLLQGKSGTGKGVLFLVSDRKNKVSPNTDPRTVMKVILLHWCCHLLCIFKIHWEQFFAWFSQFVRQIISRTSLLVLLEDVRNPHWLNKILESRYDEDQVLLFCHISVELSVSPSDGVYLQRRLLASRRNHGHCKPGRNILNKNLVARFGHRFSKRWQQLFQVDPKICDERFSDRLAVIPFGRMSSNLSASAMQSKANEYDRFISSNEKPMEFIISEMGDYIRRYKMF